MLTAALQAKEAKMTKKMKMIELQMRLIRLNAKIVRKLMHMYKLDAEKLV